MWFKLSSKCGTDASMLPTEIRDIMTGDLNYPSGVLLKAARALQPDIPIQDICEIAEATRAELKRADDNSPYPEVRACVDASDDPTMPTMTFRVWIIGAASVAVTAVFNQFFQAREPELYLPATVMQVIAFPLGILMAKIIPTRSFHFGRRSFTLNPGPFNIKEHALITIMLNTSGTPYATSMIAVLRLKRFYNNPTLGSKLGFQISLLVSTQLMGYALAGVTRSFLVYYREMVWWEILPQISIIRALHVKSSRSPVHGWKITPMKFFFACTLKISPDFILPSVFFESLSYFNWTTWIAPDNVKLALITGTVSGLGMNPFPTLDWNIMFDDPIIQPLWTITNTYIGTLCASVIISVIYFKNWLFTSYLPINTSVVFDRHGKRYNASRLLDTMGGFDQNAYEAYSPPFMSASQTLYYAGYFAVYPTVVIESLLHHRKFISEGLSHYWALCKNNFKGDSEQKSAVKPRYVNDIHYRLMQSYPLAPNSWFVVIGVFSIALAIFMNEFYDTKLPIWGLVSSSGSDLTISNVTVRAGADIPVHLNVLAELVGGYIFPGRPLGNMLFKTYTTQTVMQAHSFAADMKLAHYMKLPPRAVFICQTVATVFSMLLAIAGTTRSHSILFAEKVLRSFMAPWDQRAYSLKLGHFIDIVSMGFSVASLSLEIHENTRYYPGLSLANVTPMFALALFFQGYLKRWYLSWYEKYAIVAGSGIPAGIAIFGLVYVIAFKLNGQTYDWYYEWTDFSIGWKYYLSSWVRW
ncbi:putative oligopeptide transporter [Melampsora larici-populina 98AG31]|uniref:Putative oligopeptide transporter n=1 Tax=Melampsora larici-populina (strain 98AG31 / pathotype 3-4-7) TaxID=747676 RepID=F4R6D8_MELLP|nr:putative oligopeptide transporter [Melampsora larici-populina 98AG31]EGG12478.1 putative oligopeptide transporter [Melampsora larici-populina 98AG31]